jgi:hypothetical protein
MVIDSSQASERAQPHALDRVATVIDRVKNVGLNYSLLVRVVVFIN